MIGTQHNPLVQGGGWLIESEPPEQKKDRAQAVLYRAPGPRQHRRSQSSPSEEYAYRNDRCVAEALTDRPDEFAKPPRERPGIIRLLQVGLCSGSLLLDQLDEVGDGLTQAVSLSHYFSTNRRVVANGHVSIERLMVRASGAKVVEAELDPGTPARQPRPPAYGYPPKRGLRPGARPRIAERRCAHWAAGS